MQIKNHRYIDRRGFVQRLTAHIYLWVLLLLLYAPIAVILVCSFTESKVLGNWTGFSLKLYANLFSGVAGSSLTSAIINTGVIALVAATISTFLGTIAAFGIYYMKPRYQGVVMRINQIPIINPDIITGISLFLLFVAIGVDRGLGTVIAAHVVFCTPYVILSVMPRLKRMTPNLYEAALDLGARPAQAFWKVIIPEVLPGMITGFILALTLSIDDFGVTLFTKGSEGLHTLSTYIYADARKGGLTPELRPLFTLIFITILILLIVSNIRASKATKK